jgi:predicted TPR repeat methyltransferase
VAPDPDSLDAARRLFLTGHLKEAFEACQRTLARDPANLEAEKLLAHVMVERGQVAFASLAVQRLIAEDPNDADLHTLLAYIHRHLGDAVQAVAAIDRALELDAENVIAGVEAVAIDLATDAVNAAVARSRQLVDANPDSGDAALAHASALLADGEQDRARAVFARAVELNSDIAHRHLRLTHWHRRWGNEDGARRTLAEGTMLQPDQPTLAHLYVAATGDPTGSRVPDEYLVRHFDAFAPVFDERLEQDLEYSLPAKLTGLLGPLVGDRAGTLVTLDAGCGTGLCGPLLRPLSNRLVGVDISPGMLTEASRRGLYDELVAEELTAFLRRHPARFDAVVAADVLMYFGDLTEAITLMAESLRPAGLIAFSVERAESARVLQTSGRYAHTEEDVRAVAERMGLELQMQPTDLRMEFNRPVPGLLFIGRGG